MANTYTKIYLHIVFTVKRREKLIHPFWKNELYQYICGIVNGNKQKVYAIGGVSDHIHILISIKPDISCSELVRDIKANSSKWINQKRFLSKNFNWQEGFGAFSYAESQLDNIIRYINNQEKHHGEKTFEREYIDMLKDYHVDYDEKYLFG